MKKHIEDLKMRFHEARMGGKGCVNEYIELMQAVYQLPVVFTVLSREDFDNEKKTSIPWVCKAPNDDFKDPTIYIFSDLDLAVNWMNHFRYVTEDMAYGLIGAAEKKPFDLQLSLYQVARAVGVKNILLDDGGTFVWLGLENFIDANDIDKEHINVFMGEEYKDQLISGQITPKVGFTRMKALPTMRK